MKNKKPIASRAASINVVGLVRRKDREIAILLFVKGSAVKKLDGMAGIAGVGGGEGCSRGLSN